MSETPQDYPNIRAMASGTISGAWREWPLVRGEAKALLAERDALRLAVAKLEDERKFWAGGDAMARLKAHDLRAESVRLSEELGEALFERDALREGSDEDARALLRLSDLLTAAEAERDALRTRVEAVLALRHRLRLQ